MPRFYLPEAEKRKDWYNPNLPVAGVGKSLRKATSISPAPNTDTTLTNKYKRRLEDLFTRFTGLGSGEVTPSEQSADAMMGAVNPLGMGIVPSNLRKVRLEKLLDSGISRSFGPKYRDAITEVLRRNPNVASHIAEVNESNPSRLVASKSLFNKPENAYRYMDMINSPGNKERMQSGSLTPEMFNSIFGSKDKEILSPLALNLNSRNSRRALYEFRNIVGHETNHAAQALRNPRQMMVYGTREGLEIPWASRPEEIAANIAGSKRGYYPGYWNTNSSIPYSDRLVTTIDKLPELSKLMLYDDFKRNPADFQAQWENYFGSGRVAPAFDYIRNIR